MADVVHVSDVHGCLPQSHFIQWQFSSLNSGPLNPNFFDDDFTEAVRLMEVDLHVVDPADSSSPVSSPSPSSSASSTPSLFAPDSSDSDNWDPSYPVIHFYGSSQGVHSGASKIKGTVRMMREGTVRWNFVSTVLMFLLALPLSSPLGYVVIYSLSLSRLRVVPFTTS